MLKPGEEPFPKDEQGNLIYADDEIDYLETWQGMEDVLKTGKVKAIGVSNFNVKQMTRLLENCNVKPAVFQVGTIFFQICITCSHSIGNN